MKTKTINSVIITLLFSVVFISCQSTMQEPAPDLDKLRSQVQEMEDAYATASNAGDAEAVVKYYSEDAISLPQNEPMLSGKSAILARLKENYEDNGGVTAIFEVVEIFAAGNLVIEIGKSTETDSDGNVINGKYMSIFENRDGKLVCIRDIWNNDAPDADDDDDNGDDDDDDDEGFRASSVRVSAGRSSTCRFRSSWPDLWGRVRPGAPS